jgi:homoserine O-succinyltransferase
MMLPEPRSSRNTTATTSAKIFGHAAARCVDIGLVNNMPDAALEATERQFRTLLGAAADGIVVRLRLLTLPGVSRSDAARDYLRGYSSVEELQNSRLDGLIVTGTEPRQPNLRDEPYWSALAKLVEWAEEHTSSTVWSCLAAHAAVLHLDGIQRRPLAEKRFGVFDYSPAPDHPLTAGLPRRFQMPHSRWNELPEEPLVACGYRVISRSAETGVDAFVRRRKNLFVFFQGHPEYDSDTLLLEYRRDVKRFCRRERDTYPPAPRGYFDDGTSAALAAIRDSALLNRCHDGAAALPADLAARVTASWRPAAAAIYRNWLRYLCAQKERRLSAT